MAIVDIFRLGIFTNEWNHDLCHKIRGGREKDSLSNAFKKENVSFILDFFPADCIFYQSAALPPLAAPAQTWKPTTANMNTFMATTAAAASVRIHIGSALLVFST